jgi:cellulose synthase/poly-beta-1,6-N-acetylglucosamine synthase-like glycosyltransferase
MYIENETKFDQNFFIKRNDQYNFIDYVKLCQEDKLFDIKAIDRANSLLVSIILYSYNNKDLTIKSLRSIQNQSFNNIEIILVDDGSNDNNTNII